MNELTRPQLDLTPQSLDEALKMADMLASSDIVPKDYQNKPGNVLVAIQWGLELGLKPLQAMQNIAVINGRPALWGDAVLALVRASPVCEYVHESFLEDGTAVCTVKRRGEAEQQRTFSDADAKLAGLADKAGPWKQYPKRMKQMRARAFALRDVFADVLKGMPVAEEVQDFQPIPTAQRAPRQTPAQIAQQAAADELDQAALDKMMVDGLIEKLEVHALEGEESFKSYWLQLSTEEKTAVGIEERDRILEMARTTEAER